MFNNQSTYSDTYEREKIRILQALNVQIQSMAVKLDQIVTQVEENLFKIKPTTTLISISNSDDTNNHNNKLNTISADSLAQHHQIQLQNTNNLANTIVLHSNNNSIELANNHQLIKIIDEPLTDETASNTTLTTKANRNANRKSRLSFQSNSSSTTIKSSPNNINTTTTTNNNNNNNLLNESKIQLAGMLTNSNNLSSSSSSTTTTPNATVTTTIVKTAPDTTAKRNKQQRQFNTFVRESINQLLGPDFMRTHDVQDIDAQVMDMIRKEAVENYLPENIRPRRAWHLAKASLRTLKRTLNNRK